MARNTSVAEKPASLPATESEPTEAEQVEIRALANRKKARRQAPRFAVQQQEDSEVQMEPAGVHADAAGARLINALGITNIDLAECLTAQIMNTTHVQPPGTPLNVDSLNAALAAVTGIAPRDEAEAMLAAQMVGVHWLAMDLLSKAGSTTDRALLNDRGNLAVKLLRTYTTQIEALKRYRSTGEQRVVVQHQHVNVTADQAAVQVNGMAPDPGGRGRHRNWRNEPMRKQIPPALPMHQSLRCHARTRQGTPCRQPAVSGKTRCRMHGGAEQSGGQPGNRNALKHGRYTVEAVARRREVAALLRACRDQLGAMCDV
jgi:hypothetical protein